MVRVRQKFEKSGILMHGLRLFYENEIYGPYVVACLLEEGFHEQLKFYIIKKVATAAMTPTTTLGAVMDAAPPVWL